MNRRAMTIKRNYRLLPLVAAVMLAACGPRAAEPGPLAGSSIGGPFTLENAAGKPVHWSDFKGKYRIVYFGYTYCPDVCPTDMARLMQGFAKFKAKDSALAAQIQPIFISVDPDRDTPAKIGEFTHAFSDDLMGLTGTPEQVKAAADAFKVYYEKAETKNGAYLVNHTSSTYLFGRDGEPIALLPVDQGPDAVVTELERWTS
jgi:protein SCO1/2